MIAQIGRYFWRKLLIPYFLMRRLTVNLIASSSFYNKQVYDRGFKIFERTGVTPEESYQALIKLYCNTNGRFNEEMHKKIITSSPARMADASSESIIGRCDEVKLNDLNKELNDNGYVMFEKKLSAEMCSRLYAFALKTPASVGESKILYNPAQPISEIYRFDINDLMNSEDIQALVMDPGLINIARKYLECEPIFDFPALWWSTSFLKNASSRAAQLYHFDMDRIKWLKVFIYINDVNPENGPHCYIRGSHKPGSKPLELLKRGYVRIDDPDLHKFYKQEDFISVTGDAGSIFAGDTRCWHKGTPLKEGHRLALELEYTSSRFGGNYPPMIITKCSSEFRQFCARNQRYASAIQFQDKLN